MPAPVLAVSVLVRHRGRVLLVRRGRPPFKNVWALPGGKLLPGETLTDAAAREVREETGVTVGGLERMDLAEIIDRDARGRLRSHHVVIVFAGRAQPTAPVAADDAREALWVDVAEAAGLPLTPDTARVLTGLRRSKPRAPRRQT
jgi:ADP-ribose pyrophosphatase YjhB (NUDIX family)